MSDFLKGIAAGCVATIILSGLILLKNAVGLGSQPDLTSLLGIDRTSAWILHMLLGSLVYGAAFAWLEPNLTADNFTRKGILFGLIAWLIAMIALMPLAGGGLFGLKLSLVTPILTLIAHVVYGAMLGWVYGLLLPIRLPLLTHKPRTT